MEQKNIETPDLDNYENINDNQQSDNKQSIIFKRVDITGEYIEILKEMQNIELIIRNSGMLNLIISDYDYVNQKQLEQFKEITFIFDYTSFSEELDLEKLDIFITNMNNKIDKTKTKINLIIKNCYINTEGDMHQVSKDNNLILNKLEIYDELYMLSTCLQEVFPNIKVTELILRRFKFNSKSQLSRFCEFIRGVECTKLTLDDIFIELIIKKSEDDDEYKDLDIYFSYLDGIITLENVYTNITSLTLRDAPLFAMIGKTFKKVDDPEGFKFSPKDIDIDETSLINPSIITKFKINKGKFDICFDLDSFKSNLEEEQEDGNDYDDIDYLVYIFKIILSFKRNHEKIKIKDDEDGISEISRENIHRLTFKNFDMTKFEYIFDDEITYIEKEDWIYNSEQKERKKKWEDLEDDLDHFETKNELSNVTELVFDNCSNFFIKWIIRFIKGKNYVKKSNNNDFDLIKIKKCGNEYFDLSFILQMKIGTLILFDTPLIIGDNFPPEKNTHLSNMKEKSLGTIDNLELKIISLECYGRERNLNILKTFEILVELINCKNFNNNITFGYSALSNIMTFLAYRVYIKNLDLYNDSNELEKGEDKVTNLKDKMIQGYDGEEIFEKNPKFLPKQMFFGSKSLRDYLYYQSFKLEEHFKNSKITLKNVIIRKQIENYENNEYLMKKKEKKEKLENKSSAANRHLKKIDFGSDGFYIDRDYKNFFSINKIKCVELVNVNFSNVKIPDLRNYEGETIINLINNSDYEEKNIEDNNYEPFHYPNYTIDMKTLNGILFKNHGFEDFGSMFKYYIYRIESQSENVKEVTSDAIDKKKSIKDYFNKYKDVFDKFKNNIKKLTVIINNLKELKEFYLVCSFLEILGNQNYLINEILKYNNKEVSLRLPDKKEMEKRFGIYFYKEKNEFEKDVYSEINYYFISEKEEEILKTQDLKEKYFQSLEYQIYYDLKFENIYIH